jgi:hypothetical protein
VKRGIRSIQQASDEFTEAVRWYEKRRPGLGGEFFDAVCATMALIEARPEIGTIRRFRRTESSCTGSPLPRFPASPTRWSTA